ncbi:LPS-assembly lipoprotein LptE [Legionella spiritensis]|nr:LPS assembly lipoprotein LptE [Legionella spiritensis]
MPTWLKNVALIIESAHRDLEPTLKDQLQAYNVTISPSAAKASYLLIIEKDENQQQITSVSASTTPRQYQLFYRVWFRLVSNNGNVIIPSSQVTVTRQLTVNNDRILGSDSEEITIHREMRRDAAMQIIYRLNRKS